MTAEKMQAMEMGFEEFWKRYADENNSPNAHNVESARASREAEKQNIKSIMRAQIQIFAPDGWMLLECHMMHSSYMGELTILPFGPKNTHKVVPDHPVTPRGLASDQAVVIAVLPVSKLDE